MWERDGNIQYLNWQTHSSVCVCCSSSCSALVSVHTCFSLHSVASKRQLTTKCCRWVTKLKPFFDAFTGPFKDKHRYWVGGLLLARCFLLLVFYIYTANGSGVAFIIHQFCCSCYNFGLLSSHWVLCTRSIMYLTLLELSYILNLGMLAAGTVYVSVYQITMEIRKH